jgi:hypothetical protein
LPTCTVIWVEEKAVTIIGTPPRRTWEDVAVPKLLPEIVTLWPICAVVTESPLIEGVVVDAPIAPESAATLIPEGTLPLSATIDAENDEMGLERATMLTVPSEFPLAQTGHVGSWDNTPPTAAAMEYAVENSPYRIVLVYVPAEDVRVKLTAPLPDPVDGGFHWIERAGEAMAVREQTRITKNITPTYTHCNRCR